MRKFFLFVLPQTAQGLENLCTGLPAGESGLVFGVVLTPLVSALLP